MAKARGFTKDLVMIHPEVVFPFDPIRETAVDTPQCKLLLEKRFVAYLGGIRRRL